MTKLNKKTQKRDYFRDETGLKIDTGIPRTSHKNCRLPNLPRIEEVLSPAEQLLLQKASDLNQFINAKIDEDAR